MIHHLLVHTTLARDLCRLVGTKLAEECLVCCVLRVHSIACNARRRYQRAEVVERFGFNLVTRLLYITHELGAELGSEEATQYTLLPSSIGSPRTVQYLGGGATDCLPVCEWMGLSSQCL